LDETGKNDKTACRHYGRSPKNKRAEMKLPFVRGRKLSAEGLLTLDGMVARKVVEGSIKRDVFLEWLEHQVV
ncbi:hypothetical protein C8J56DRAFT_717869, partial [Mycena floridula]